MATPNPLQQFLDLFQAAFENGHFLKCTLSKPATIAPSGLKNIFLRPVQIKATTKIACNFRFQTRDEVKNYDLPETLLHLREWLGDHFANADFAGTEQDAALRFDRKGNPTISVKTATQTAPADTRHDREKNRLLDPAASWLHLLGITNTRGDVLAAAQDKWRQINKFLENIAPLIAALPRDAHIADMGAGKGYLTFALYDFLKNKQDMSPQITGIELRPGLVEFCNKTAQQVGFQGLVFVAERIEQYNPERLDLLIALHACDTATDMALAKGIHAGAKAIVVAPCCHKQIRREMSAQNELAPVLRHGILEERQAEIVTDGIRALLLESQGYRTQVFEFISTEHTAKNLLITAEIVRPRMEEARKREALDKVAALKTGFGIKTHFLEGLLNNDL